MGVASRDKWDARYRALNCDAAKPARVLSENLHLLPAGARACDVACGLGGSAVLLARLGFDVVACDISTVAVAKLNAYAQRHTLKLCAKLHDIEKQPLAPASYDVVTVSYFLERTIATALIESLRPAGLLFYQTFTLARTDHSGPHNPAFRLGRNELLRLFAPLNILFYREEGLVGDLSRGFRNEAMLIGQRAADSL